VATGAAIAAVIHHRAAMVPLILPVLMLQAPSRSMMLIGTAPLRARYSTARFLFGERDHAPTSKVVQKTAPLSQAANQSLIWLSRWSA
jgi:hypothetical protein